MSTDENRQAPPRTSPETPSEPQPGHGVLVRARNGDVIRYDSTGLVLRLSDRVIADIAMRLGTPGGGAAAPEPIAGRRPTFRRPRAPATTGNDGRMTLRQRRRRSRAPRVRNH